MRKILKSSLVILLISLMAIPVLSQEMTKEEKRAHKKEARKLLKESVKLMEENKLDDAILLLDSLIIYDPKNADAYYNKGKILTAKADPVNALAALEKGTKLAPLSTRIKILLARLKLEKGDFDDAASELDFVLSIKPHESEALYLRGLVHQKKDETKQALERFKKALDSYYAKGTK